VAYIDPHVLDPNGDLDRLRNAALGSSAQHGLLGRLFPVSDYGGLLDPRAIQRQGLLALGTNLLQAGGRSPNQRGTLANIGSALSQVNIPDMIQTAMRMRKAQEEFTQEREAQSALNRIAQKYPPVDGETPEGTYNRLAKVVGELALTPGSANLVGKLSNVLAQLKPSGGGVEDQRQFTRANQMYGRFLQQTKKEQEIALNYNAVLSATRDPSPAGDLSLIFAYMKMLDPGSVVREGEFATAANTGSVPERIRAQYNKIISGERLTTGQRADFLGQARARAKGVRSSLQRVIDEYGRRATTYKIDPEDVTYDYFAGIGDEPNPDASGPPPVTPPTLARPKLSF